jgi:hypothetical protein
MATSQQVADGIRDLEVHFDDAEELHQVLLHLHEITEATREKFQQLGDRVSETGLKEHYADAIHEAANDLSGVGDKVQSVVGGGVLQG